MRKITLFSDGQIVESNSNSSLTISSAEVIEEIVVDDKSTQSVRQLLKDKHKSLQSKVEVKHGK